MPKQAQFLACLLALLASPMLGATSDPRSTLIVDSKWLDAHRQDANLVLLHVGDAQQYAAGHIPGARLVALDDISVSEHTSNGLMLELPPPEDLRKRLEKIGISDASKVVVYYGQDWVSPSTRVLFTLQHAGLGERAVLLDGGMAAWTAQGGALSSEPVPLKPGALAPLRTQPLVVDADFVRTHRAKPGFTVIDGRAAVYYDGVERGGQHGQQERAGHIAGARSIPFTEITDEQLLLRSQAELRALFDAAGVKPGDTVIGYCHIGQQATAMLYAARLLGHPIKLYDGSYQDWSRGSANPVENPSASKP